MELDIKRVSKSPVHSAKPYFSRCSIECQSETLSTIIEAQFFKRLRSSLKTSSYALFQDSVVFHRVCPEPVPRTGQRNVTCVVIIGKADGSGLAWRLLNGRQWVYI